MEYSNGQKIVILFHECVNLFSRKHGPDGGSGRSLPAGQARILHILEENDGLSQKELAEKLHIRQPSLTELLRKLNLGGYVVLRQNKDDKRITNVFSTSKGKKAVQKEMAAKVENMANTVFASFSSEEQTTFIELLERLLASLENQNNA
jgi:DNA-binding MarR family transcriptional regulator